MKPKLTLNILNVSVSTFLFLTIIGLAAALIICFVITWLVGLDVMASLLLSGVIISANLCFAWCYKITFGYENLVYYRQKIVVIISSGIMLYVLSIPLFPYLDIVVIGIGTMVCIARWGCYHVGCCHGVPCHCNWGTSYSKEHAKKGFPSYLVGLSLVPTPVIESFFLLCIVVSSILILFKQFPPGTVFSFYIISYGTVRFVIEYFRGDSDRPYLWLLSEAQHTSILLSVLVLYLSLMDTLPYYEWQLYITLIVMILGFATILHGHLMGNSKLRIWQPKHIREIAGFISNENLQQKTPNASTVLTNTTSQGLCFSKGQVVQNEQLIHFYTFSKAKTQQILNTKEAASIAQLLCILYHPQSQYQIQQNKKGIYHILFTESSPLSQ